MTTKPADRAATTMLEGYNCARSVLSACDPAPGLERETCLRLAVALGGGLARSGDACGAVSGALLAIGLARAGAHPSPEAKELAHGPAGAFLARWRERHGSIACRELAGCDVSTPEGLQAFRDGKGYVDDWTRSNSSRNSSGSRAAPARWAAVNSGARSSRRHAERVVGP